MEIASGHHGQIQQDISFFPEFSSKRRKEKVKVQGSSVFTTVFSMFILLGFLVSSFLNKVGYGSQHRYNIDNT